MTYKKIKNKGFTLIELLVVVIIIAILAAIAFPQYEIAVEKARLSKYMPIVKAIASAQDRHFLTTGSFSSDIDELDITVPLDSSCVKTYPYRYECDWGIIAIMDGLTNVQAGTARVRYLHYIQDYSGANFSANKGDIFCFAKVGSSIAEKACTSLNGTKIGASASWNYYKIQ